MKITDLLNKKSIVLNVKSKNKKDILTKAINLMYKTGVIRNKKTYTEGIFNREKESTTGVGEGVAIPHCKSKTVAKPQLVAMVVPEGVDFESLDGEKVKLLFMIAAPDSKENVHLDVLATLSNLLMHEEFSKALLGAKTTDQFIKIIDGFESKRLLEEQKNETQKEASTSKYPDLLAATACPTGIAHTYMAKEALEKACITKNVSIKVETNGSGGQKNGLTPDEIKNAKAIIVAADAYVEMSRFDGKHVVEVGTSKAIKDPAGLIDRALSPKCPIYKAKGSSRKEQSFGEEKKSKFQIFYRHLMSGISHMIPFVVAGGIILAIAYIIDACLGNGQNPNFGHVSLAAQVFNILGANLGLGLMLPVLGGFIAYSIAGKPGLVSGFVGSFGATYGQFNLMYVILKATNPKSEWITLLESNSAGFLGAIIAGFAAGYLVLLMQNKWFNKMPRTLEGIRDILIVPLTSTLLIGAFMLLVNVPLSLLNIGIEQGLMALANLKLIILLGALVSALMAIDMGGPINKAAHYTVLAIMTSALQTGASAELKLVAKQLMAANIVGIMTPPVGIAIATWLFPQKFAKEDRKASLANVVTGCCGITEGAIPYVAKDPIRVVASTVTGAAVGGLVAIAWGAEAIAPEGGVISMLSMGAICYRGILAMIIGSLVTALCLGLLKKDVAVEQSLLSGWKGIPFGIRNAQNKVHALNIRLANQKPELNTILLEDYTNRIEAVKSDIDLKLAAKKERVKPERYKKALKRAEAKKAKLDAKIVAKKEKLTLKAKKRSQSFDANKFAKYEAKINKRKEAVLLREQKRIQKRSEKLEKKNKKGK